MCFSIPFRIYFKDVSEIIRDCFGLQKDKTNYKNSNKNEINMDLIESQPILNDHDEGNVFLPDSDEELVNSYDLMDSD